jgi:hypothetical protein
MKEIIYKITAARNHIASLDIKKKGHNDYSNYDYYTPEQITAIMRDIENKFGLHMHFDLVRDDFGKEMGILYIYDTESGSNIQYKMAIETAELKATNKAQQYGGTMTYCKRYLQMNAFDIADNSSDFDAIKKASKEIDKKTLKIGSPIYKKVIDAISTGVKKYDEFDGYYIISDEVKEQITKDVKARKAGIKKSNSE